jgi:mannose-6-phosphate isomerase-like protein (cupin superfamily)
LSGSLTIRMDDSEVTLHQGDPFVVPRGRVHQPNAV